MRMEENTRKRQNCGCIYVMSALVTGFALASLTAVNFYQIWNLKQDIEILKLQCNFVTVR